jgi:thymidylate synthase ThyX
MTQAPKAVPVRTAPAAMEYPYLDMPDNQPAALNSAAPAAETDVYAIHGADPEVLAYAMAKYSRSSLNMKESLSEISSQRAEQFLNTFYFQYGHRSIADLAHIPFAIERLSLLAAIALVDEQRWDGQERSTRYQNFRKSGWYTPQLTPNLTTSYTASVEALFAAYDQVSAGMLEALKRAIPQPSEMKDEAYIRTLKARAFDVARYLLPLATNTSLGQIVSARTLENQISRLLTSEVPEIRALGEKLKTAAASPAWNVQHDAARVLCAEVSSVDELCGCRITDTLLREVKAAPTLVKYAAPNEYTIASRKELRAAATELMSGQSIEAAPVVDLVEDAGPLEIELATSLLYPECHYSWRQLQRTVSALSASRVSELIALGTKHRGRHDELPRTFSAGQSFKFDILMDIGGFRDMHRHRRCVQLIQPFTDLHGYEEPECPGQPTLAEAGLHQAYHAAMNAAHAAYRAAATTACHSERSEESPPGAGAPSKLRLGGPVGTNSEAAYLLPLGTRVRAMFKMDFAEALYIAELRSGVAGHFSYRRVAWEMYLAVAKRHPALAKCFRIEDVNQPVDLLKR